MRIFLALDISSALRERLAPILDRLQVDGLSPVRPDQIHVTIKFLGETDEGGLAFVKEQLGSIHDILKNEQTTGVNRDEATNNCGCWERRKRGLRVRLDPAGGPAIIDMPERSSERDCRNVSGIVLSSTNIGSFGSPPQVLWLGLGKNPALDVLHAEIERLLAQQFPKEERSFSPHLTLARVKRWTPAAETIWHEFMGKAIAESWIANEIVLYRSVLTPEGARYERVTTVSFK